MEAAEPVKDAPVQGATPTNTNNLSSADRWRVSVDEEPTIYMARSEVEAMLRREK